MARTTLDEAKEVLAGVEAIRKQEGMTKRQLADRLGVSPKTLEKWFYKKGARAPSMTHLSKLRLLVGAATRATVQQGEVWKKIRGWWRTQHRYSSLEQLAQDVGWTVGDLRIWLETESCPPRLIVERLAQLSQLQTPSGALSSDEARRRSERLKAILTILAEELAWFRDGPADVREVYRSELDPFDSGYVSSLLTMLFAEEKFRRWLEVTTNRFNYFKTEGSRR